MTSWDKYGAKAAGWSELQYADSTAYLAHRAELVRTLGPALAAGDTILDLACGDGGLADFLPDQHYVGIDASDEMVSSGRARGRELILADLNEYVPSMPVQATTIFRAIYYAKDRAQLLARIAGYTEKKLVFDLNPRQYRLDDVRADLRAAGFAAVEVQPFFVPQTRALPAALLRLLPFIERSGPIARAVLRYRFTFLCAASVTKR